MLIPNSYCGLELIESPSLSRKEKRTFKEFFSLKPRFRFYKVIPDNRVYKIKDRYLVAHPIVIEAIKKELAPCKILAKR
jgi:hypothetical protein